MTQSMYVLMPLSQKMKFLPIAPAPAAGAAGGAAAAAAPPPPPPPPPPWVQVAILLCILLHPYIRRNVTKLLICS